MVLKKGMTIEEIDRELSGKGDFVQIDYMTSFLKLESTFEIRKYVSMKLSDVYEKRGMFSESAKIYEMIGEFAKGYAEQTKYFVRAAELYIMADLYPRADECIRKALRETKIKQQNEIEKNIKNLYINQAEKYLTEKRRSNSVKIYEKLLVMNISKDEREDIKKKLLGLYEELGRMREYYMLKGKIEKI